MVDEWEDPTERQARQEEWQKLLKARLRAAVRRIGMDETGRDFLRWLFEECGVFRQDFPRYPVATAWSAGRRALGLEIFDWCLKEGLADVILDPVRQGEEGVSGQ